MYRSNLNYRGVRQPFYLITRRSVVVFGPEMPRRPFSTHEWQQKGHRCIPICALYTSVVF